MSGVVFPPAGRCIYCGAIEGELTGEHIVPLGLGGDLELPKASCAKCRDVTSYFELGTLRGAFYRWRLKHIPAKRRKKSRPTGLEGFVGDLSIEIPVDDLAAHAWILPIFAAQPGILLGILPWQVDKHPDWKGVYSVQDANRQLRPAGEAQVSVPIHSTDPSTFSQFLAKVAHSYAYALLGPDGFEPMLTTFIRQRFGRPRYWTASRGSRFCETQICISEDTEIYSVQLTSVESIGGVTYAAVMLRFFGFYATPQYLVVVGKAKGGALAQAKGTRHVRHLTIPLPSRYEDDTEFPIRPPSPVPVPREEDPWAAVK